MKSKLFFLFLICSFSDCLAQNELRTDSVSVSFEYNQSVILNETELRAQLSGINAAPLAFIRVVGYTDATGSLKRNEALAADRIRSVEAILQGSEFKKVRVERVNANETSGFRVVPDELNRRVDILFYTRNEPPKRKETLTFELNKPLNLQVNFRGGTADFLTSAYPNLEKLKNAMLADTTLQLKLHGHVCCADDMELSVKRAYAVMRYLSQNDVDYKRMSAEGFSNSRLLVPDDSEEHMSMNRRVEAIFYRRE